MKKSSFIFLFFFSFLCTAIFAQAGTWTQKASLPDTSRADAMSFAIGTKGYITQGGDASLHVLHSMWEYDATNNSWIQKQNFSGSIRWQGVSFSIGAKGYIGTGEDQTTFYNNDFWEYDPASDTWTQKASMPTPGRNFAVGFSIGNKGYVGLGLGITAALNDFWEYDAVLNAWTQKANFPAGGRYLSVGLCIDTKGYVGAGHQGNSYYNDFWEYDPLTDAWTQKTNFPGGTRGEIDGAHFSIGNDGYVGTGRTPLTSTTWQYYNDFWRYNPSTDTWVAIPNLPAAARIGASAFSINNIGYVGLGCNGVSITYNDLWAFNPNPVVTNENENADENPITVYPNPSSGIFTLNSKIIKGEIIICNAQGEIVYESKIISANTKIDLTDEPNGIYFVHVKTEAGSFTQKIIIEK